MHKSHDYITGKITHAERLNNSVNGNPRFRVTVFSYDETGQAEAGTYLTSSDSSSAYDVYNALGSGEVVTFGLTRAGRIETITRESVASKIARLREQRNGLKGINFII